MILNNEDAEELINENNFESPLPVPKIYYLPEFKTYIDNKQLTCILDSGSQASLISEATYYDIKKINKNNFPELPVSNVQITGIIGKKGQRINKQVLLPININGEIIEINCLIVKNVKIELLLGCDFFDQYQAKLDFKNKIVILELDNGKCVEINFMERQTMNFVGKVRIIQSSFMVTNMSHDTNTYACNEIADTLGYTDKEDKKTINIPQDNDERRGDMNELLNKIKDIENNVSDQDKIGFDDLKNVLIKNKSVFSNRPGLIKGFKATLNMKEKNPYIGKSYPVPFSKRKTVDQELKNMIHEGIIEPSKSPYSNPLVVVVKRDLSIRLCLDSRKLNKYLVNDCERTDKIENILQRFTGAKYFTSIDLTQGFLQVELDPESRKYTAFTFAGKNYMFKRLPFGLMVSSALFIKAMDHIFGAEFQDYLVSYVDDLLIFSRSYNSHIQHIDNVLSRLLEFGATVKLKKSNFLQKEINFLGYVVGKDGIRMDPERVKKIKELPEPRNIKELQSILGLMNYYRGFQKQFAELSGRLSHLLSSKSIWKWGEDERRTFNELKQGFMGSIILEHPDFSKPFYLGTDASDIAVSAILYQENDDKEQKVIMFASRKLIAAEKGYSISEKELLAIVFGCKKFRSYLIGHPKVIIRTDHRALTFLKTCRLTHGRLLRWSLYLQEFNFEMEFIKGKDNVACDVLSRMDETGINDSKIDEIKVFKVDLGYKQGELINMFKQIKDKQRQDEKYGPVIINLESNEVDEKIEKCFKLHEDILFKSKLNDTEQWCLCIPQEMIHTLIDFTHRKFGHLGARKIYNILKEYCTFPKMEKLIKQQIRTCDLCQKAKHITRAPIGMLQPIIPARLRQIISIDLIGELPTGVGGVKYIFSLVELYSKYVKLYAIRRPTSKTLLNKLINHYIPHVGPIEYVLSDHGTQFTSKLWDKAIKENGIKVVHSSIYHPQSNPIERSNKEINKLCRIYCNVNHTRWPQYLGFIEECLNHSVHDTTHMKPYEVLFGRPSKYFLDRLSIRFPDKKFDHDKILELVKTNIMHKAEKRKASHDNKIKPVSYQVGEKVLIKTHYLSDKLNKKIKKFFLLYEGPYQIIEIKKENAYVLAEVTDLNKIQGTYNTTQLKKYFEE